MDVAENPPAVDEADSDFEAEDFERFAAEQPFKLKDAGNKKFGEGKYEDAINLWMQGVKETLKRSVRTPSAALYQNQVRIESYHYDYIMYDDHIEVNVNVLKCLIY